MKCLRKLQRLPEAMQAINEYLTQETDEKLMSSLLSEALDISVEFKGRMTINHCYSFQMYDFSLGILHYMSHLIIITVDSDFE